MRGIECVTRTLHTTKVDYRCSKLVLLRCIINSAQNSLTSNDRSSCFTSSNEVYVLYTLRFHVFRAYVCNMNELPIGTCTYIIPTIVRIHNDFYTVSQHCFILSYTKNVIFAIHQGLRGRNVIWNQIQLSFFIRPS